ncbi:MAG: DUF4276 family protein [Pyrinomonadaceae bacterium]
MHIEILVEEASAEIVLNEIMPKIIGDDATFKIHDFRGKSNLIKKLPDRMRGYSSILRDQKDWRIVVLIDEDRQDCQELKKTLEEIAIQAGLSTRSSSDNFQVLNRIAVEELEAWFFGDIEALRGAYPRVPPSLMQRRSYRNPDEIRGGTYEALERVLSTAGYYSKGFMPKSEVARNIAPFMSSEINSSKSFQVFRDGLKLFLD